MKQSDGCSQLEIAKVRARRTQSAVGRQVVRKLGGNRALSPYRRDKMHPSHLPHGIKLYPDEFPTLLFDQWLTRWSKHIRDEETCSKDLPGCPASDRAQVGAPADFQCPACALYSLEEKIPDLSNRFKLQGMDLPNPSRLTEPIPSYCIHPVIPACGWRE